MKLLEKLNGIICKTKNIVIFVITILILVYQSFFDE